MGDIKYNTNLINPSSVSTDFNNTKILHIRAYTCIGVGNMRLIKGDCQLA